MKDDFDFSTYPNPDMVDGLRMYIRLGRCCGSFMDSVLSNNLKDAVMLADDVNRAVLVQTVDWLYNNAPAACWGSRDAVRAWEQAGGLVGLQRARLEAQSEDEL